MDKFFEFYIVGRVGPGDVDSVVIPCEIVKEVEEVADDVGLGVELHSDVVGVREEVVVELPGHDLEEGVVLLRVDVLALEFVCVHS